MAQLAAPVRPLDIVDTSGNPASVLILAGALPALSLQALWIGRWLTAAIAAEGVCRCPAAQAGMLRLSSQHRRFML